MFLLFLAPGVGTWPQQLAKPGLSVATKAIVLRTVLQTVIHVFKASAIAWVMQLPKI